MLPSRPAGTAFGAVHHILNRSIRRALGKLAKADAAVVSALSAGEVEAEGGDGGEGCHGARSSRETDQGAIHSRGFAPECHVSKSAGRWSPRPVIVMLLGKILLQSISVLTSGDIVMIARVLLACALICPAPGMAFSDNQGFDGLVEHGGGCRKSSPAGQCCHMDRKAGKVHCH